MAYPTGDELQAYLVTAGIIQPNTNEALDYQGFMDAAIAQWELDTGYTPFLFDNNPINRFYDTPDGDFLDLQGGLLNIEDPENFTLDGRTLVVGTDFDLYPYDAIARGKPYTAVKFRYKLDGRYATPKNISLLGEFGYCNTLPADVRIALLSLAAFNLLPSASNTTVSNGTITQIRQDDVTISYGSNSSTNHYSAVQLQQKSFYDKTLARYKRVRLV